MPFQGTDPISLPPPEAWLINPNERMDTPVDDLGITDIDTLITDVNETIVPEYQWKPGLSVHHFQWPEAWYLSADASYDDAPLRQFRNLPPHKGLVPREFENWVHRITLPPELPSPDIIKARTDSWAVARSLFDSIKDYVQYEKLARRRKSYLDKNPNVLPASFDGVDIIGEEIMQEIFEKHFRGINIHLEQLSAVPAEHKFVDETAGIHEISKQLGKLVVPRARVLVRAAA